MSVVFSFDERESMYVTDEEYKAVTGMEKPIGSVKRFEVCEQFRRVPSRPHEVHLWMGTTRVIVVSFMAESAAKAQWEVLAACLVKDAKNGVRPDGR